MTGYFKKNLVVGGAEILCRLPYIFTLGYMAQQVGPALFGVWAIVVVFQGLLSALAGMGLPSALSVHAPVVDEAKARGYLMFTVMIGVAASLAGIGLTWLADVPLGRLLGLNPGDTGLLVAGGLLALGTVLDSLFDAYCKARERVGAQLAYLSTRTAIEVAVVLVIFAPTLWTALTPETRLFAYALCVVALKLFGYGALAGLDGRHVRAVPASGEARAKLLRYGTRMIAAILVMRFASQADRFALGLSAPDAVVGVYAFGASLAAYLVFLGYAIYPLLLTRVSKLHAENATDEIRRLFGLSQGVYLRLLALALAGLALFSGEIIAMTAGAAFAAASGVLFVLAIAVSIDHFFGIYEFSMMAGQRHRSILLTHVFHVTLIIVLVYLLGGYGPLAAAWGMVAAALLHNGLRYFLAQRSIRVPVDPINVMAFAGVAAAAVLLHNVAGGLELLPRIAIAAIILPGLSVYSVRGLLKCAV